MNKQELYEKLRGIYGGQKELIEDVVNAFEELQKQQFPIGKELLSVPKEQIIRVLILANREINNLKKQNDTLMSALMITKQKYKNDKARYRRKAKKYKMLINKAKKYMNENMIDIIFEENKKPHCYWNMVKADDVEAILNGLEPFFERIKPASELLQEAREQREKEKAERVIIFGDENG